MIGRGLYVPAAGPIAHPTKELRNAAGRVNVSPVRAVTRLEEASLDQLMEQYPEEWRVVGEQLLVASKQGPAALNTLLTQARTVAAPWREQVKRSHGNPQVLAQALPKLAAARMASLAIERILQSAATGVVEGPIRLGFFRGVVLQRLLFGRALERKPVSMSAFRLLWPLLGADRKRLMALVQPKGIYCFYSSALITELKHLIAGRECLEVAAGDGTLTRFLTEAGVPARATDDFSWSHAVTYPKDVERLDAVSALRKYAPKVVVCSFPPPGNTFESRVLADPNVELYVVVTTKHRFAAGDWDAYDASQRLTRRADEHLSTLVLPPEVDPLVLVFSRPGGAEVRDNGAKP